jgi:hypothetical protein
MILIAWRSEPGAILTTDSTPRKGAYPEFTELEFRTCRSLNRSPTGAG